MGWFADRRARRHRDVDDDVIVALPSRAVGDGWAYGLDIMRATGRRAGTVYPSLTRLVAQGLVEDRWEPTTADEARPRRRQYRYVPQGQR